MRFNISSLIIVPFTLLMILLCGINALGEETNPSLEDQLKALDVSNQAPSVVTKEKFYSVQDRYLPLKNKSEVSIGLATNLTGDSFLSTSQAEIGYRFHFSNRWSLVADEAFVSNRFTEAANQLQNSVGLVPNLPYAQARTDLMVTYNVFYGKFRLGMEQVFYFDQYVSVGPGLIVLNTGDTGAAVADAGFVFWLGKWGSARLGLKDYYYNEPYPSGTSPSHNLHAHLDVGYLF